METVVLSELELKEIEKIEIEKFLNWDWNFGKSPEFNITKSKRFDGGKIDVCLNIKNGIINDCKFYGDFFYHGDINELQNLIIGCKYEKKEIIKVLKNANIEKKIHLINDDDIIESIF